MTEQNIEEPHSIEEIKAEISKATPSTRKRAYEAFTLAALGSIPWVGGFISAAASVKLYADEVKRDTLQTQWLEEHTAKIEKLHLTLDYIFGRLDALGEEIDTRIQSPQFLDIVRKAFRVWDNADTDEKRKYVADLIANASSTSLTSDDVLRLFIEWLEKYHEAHFSVIGEIYKNPRTTRFQIWKSVRGELPREDSAEADLFKMLVRDLTLGGVIRQARETTSEGEYLKRRVSRSSKGSSVTMESAFEDSKPYVLTALGDQFVHYTMTEIVPRIA